MKAFLYMILVVCMLVLGICACLDGDNLKAGAMLLLAAATPLIGFIDNLVNGSN